MSRLEAAFADGPIFIPYLVAGDPSAEATTAAVEALVAGGAGAIELGLPFSEPIAEGETIQRGIDRALRAGMTPRRYLELVDGLSVPVPLVCMTYYNLIYQFGEAPGPRPFVERAAAVGIDGFIVPDLPVEEAGPLAAACDAFDRDLVFIVAPTTTPARLERIRERGSGFVYVQARLGTTGARADVSTATRRSLDRLADWALPTGVGFGISTGAHARAVVEAGADAAIVGSALVDTVAAGHERGAPTAEVADELRRQAVDIAAGVDAAATGLAPRIESILATARARPPATEPVTVRPRSLPAALAAARADGRVPVIAEIKPTSPTSGAHRTDDAVDLAREMVAGGAAAVSVLTEEDHFGGSPAALTRVRSAVEVPVLRKDFVLDEAELDRVAADAILLIARFIDDLEGMVEAANARGFQPLVEVHTEAELHRALDAGVDLLGINNRDLARLAVDLDTFERLAPLVPDEMTVVAESGVSTCEDVRRMVAAGADGLLIGTALMDGPVRANVEALVDCPTIPAPPEGAER